MSSANFAVTDSERSRVKDTHALRLKGQSSIDELLTMLTDTSWVVRRAVVEALAFIGEPAIIPMSKILVSDRASEAKLAAVVDALVASTGPVEMKLLPLTKHENSYVVTDIAQILGRRRESSSVETLITLAHHPDDNVAVMAIEGLGRIGGRAAVEALIRIVSEGSFFRTFPAIDVLGRSSDPRAIEPLSQLLKNASYLPEAARALGRLGEIGSIPALMDVLSSSSDTIIRLAALALQDLQARFAEKSGGEAHIVEEKIRNHVSSDSVRRLSRALLSSDTVEAIAICKLLGIIGSDEAEPVLSAALNADALVSVSAAHALKRLGKNSENAILNAIREGSGRHRKVLLPLITKHGAAADVALCLKDTDPEIRAMACDTLARLGNPSVLKNIFPLLIDPNLRVVHSATAAIQALGNREGRTLAAEWFKSENAVVRRSCLRILTYFGDATALEPMLAGIQDPDIRVREAAIQGLPFLEDPKAAAALFDACKNPDPRIRSLAMRALGQLPKTSEYLFAILLKGLKDPDDWVRYYAVQSLGRLSIEGSVVEIIKLLVDPAGQVRVSAVEALSHLNVPEAHGALRVAISSTDVEVKRAALLGLGIAHRLGDLPLIITAARSEDAPTRLIALSAMINYHPANILESLSTAATDPDSQVSSAAIDLLAGVRGQEATEVLVGLLLNPHYKEKAETALLTPKEGRTAGLLVALESADDELAVLLISILTRLNRPEARDALLAAMQLNNTAARKAAASGLAARRDPEMLALLKEASEIDPSQEVRDICSLLIRN